MSRQPKGELCCKGKQNSALCKSRAGTMHQSDFRYSASDEAQGTLNTSPEQCNNGTTSRVLSFMEPLANVCSNTSCVTRNSLIHEQQQQADGRSITSSRIGPSVSHPPSIASGRVGQSVSHPPSIASSRACPSVGGSRISANMAGSRMSRPQSIHSHMSHHQTSASASRQPSYYSHHSVGGSRASQHPGSIAASRIAANQSCTGSRMPSLHQTSSGSRFQSPYASIPEQDAYCSQAGLMEVGSANYCSRPLVASPECFPIGEQPTRDCDCSRGGRASAMMQNECRCYPAGIMNEPGSEAMCLPCGHNFPDNPKDTCWRVKIMKDIGVTTKGCFENAVQTQTSETRIINADKLESLLPAAERFIDTSDLECAACKAAYSNAQDGSIMEPSADWRSSSLSRNTSPTAAMDTIQECACPANECKCAETYDKLTMTTTVPCGAPPGICRNNRKKHGSCSIM